MEEQKKILFICPDDEVMDTVKESLVKHYINLIPATTHLKGISILDKTQLDVIIAPVLETNLDGLEFTRLIRNREENTIFPRSYIILYGDENTKDDVFQSELQIDDFLSYPFYEPELIWRIKRAFSSINHFRLLTERLSVEKDSNTLTPEGFFLTLESEINRISRHTRHFSVLFIFLNNVQDLIINYGKTWEKWIEKHFLKHLTKTLRSYDRICKLTEDKYIVLIPDADITSLQGLDKRLKKEYEKFFQELREIGISQYPLIIHKGISIAIKDPIIKKHEVLEYIKNWLDEQIEGQTNEDELIACTFHSYGPEIEWE